jgi:hypothetical protein
LATDKNSVPQRCRPGTLRESLDYRISQPVCWAISRE